MSKKGVEIVQRVEDNPTKKLREAEKVQAEARKAEKPIEPEFLDILTVFIAFVPSMNQQGAIYENVVNLDLGDATKEVMDKIVDFNTGWVTLWQICGRKIMLKQSAISTITVDVKGKIEKEKVKASW